MKPWKYAQMDAMWWGTLIILVGNSSSGIFYGPMLRAILNKSWRQHPTRHQLYGHLPPITKTIQVRRTRHAGHCWRSRDEFISDVLLWTSTHGRAKARRPARTYIQQLCEDTGCSPEDLPEAMNDRKSVERGSGISVLPARHDDDVDDRSNDSVDTESPALGECWCHAYVTIRLPRGGYPVLYCFVGHNRNGNQVCGTFWEGQSSLYSMDISVVIWH